MQETQSPHLPNPTILGLGAACGPGFLMFAHYMEWQLPSWAIILIGVVSIAGLLVAIVGYCISTLKWLRHLRNNPPGWSRAMGRNLVPWILGIMGFAGVLLLAGTAIGAVFYFGQGKAVTAVKAATPPEQFVKEPTLTKWVDEKHPLVFLGTPTRTTDRLRVLVEYSIYRNGWMSPVRFELDPVKEPIKGKRFTLPVAHTGTKQNGGVEDLWWGTDPQSGNLVTNNPLYEGNVAATLTRGRIVIVGPDNKEQNATYFEIVRGLNDQNGNVRFMILQGREVSDWVSEWEKET